MVPKSRPQMKHDELRAKIAAAGVNIADHPLLIVGIRGYYEDAMGAPGKNDRGIYDDAIFIDAPGFFAAFNGNTDPSAYRKGRGTGAGKGMASLKPGFYQAHQCGLHKGKYEALVQTGGPVTVIRDGDPPYPDTGHFGINIHRGGFGTTSSEGCQTVHPSQYADFIASVHDLVKRIDKANWRKVVVPYLLIDGTV